MPKYRNPNTGETVEHPGDGLREFYLSRGWVEVGRYVGPLTAPGDEGDGGMPIDMATIIDDLSKPKKGKGA